MTINLPDTVWSPADLKELTGEVKKYARYYSHYSVKAKVTATKPSDQPPAIMPEAVDLINQSIKGASDPGQALDQLIESLSQLPNQLPCLRLTLVGPASNNLKKKLVKWCRDNLNQSLLVEFKYSSSLFGGLVVEAGSHVFDWSWRRQVLSNLSQFPEALRHV